MFKFNELSTNEAEAFLHRKIPQMPVPHIFLEKPKLFTLTTTSNQKTLWKVFFFEGSPCIRHYNRPVFHNPCTSSRHRTRNSMNIYKRHFLNSPLRRTANLRGWHPQRDRCTASLIVEKCQVRIVLQGPLFLERSMSFVIIRRWFVS